MTNKTAASRYARALFDVVRQERADFDAVDQQMGGFLDLLARHRDLEVVLLNPAVPVPRKRAAVSALLARAGTSPIVTKLLTLLAERDRLILLSDLLQSYRDRVLDYRKIVRAELTTAAPLDRDRLGTIERQLTRSTGRTIALDTKVDPGIVGGLVAKIGSTVFDGSIARQLQKMRDRLAEGL